MVDHVCSDRCSHRATAASLTALGFPVRRVDKVVGTPVVIVEGDAFELARHKACVAGALRTCTKTGRTG